MLCGLSRPTSGDCAVDGVDLLTAGSAARSRLGYMAQKFSLYPDIPVAENIKIFAELYGLDRERRKALLPVLARALELEDYLHSRTGALPLGQKQRLALLCATLHQPPVLFLDEPTSGVDARTRRDFWKHITAMTAAGASVLVTTHFMEEAEYCDRIALIYRGAMISMGTPDALKAACPGLQDPTLEEAFIASIERYDKEHPQ
ncbi:ABC transporter ATP-binding protein, partial [uncultured Desulfovibrio sp.]